MTMQEQIQIVEDNLNEYGQCNITLEEYNYIKDELYSSGCLAGMDLGRAEGIDAYVKTFCDKDNQANFIVLNRNSYSWNSYAKHVAKQLKEQNK